MGLFVVAEIGSNWRVSDSQPSRNYTACVWAIEQAAARGAAAAKFQIFRAGRLYSKRRAPALYRRAKKYELPPAWLPSLYSVAKDAGVELWASVFDVDLLPLCVPHLDCVKIASGDLTNRALVTAAAQAASGKCKFAISTGAATGDEVRGATGVVEQYHATYYLFHCVSAYPAPAREMNLAGGASMNRGQPLGLSDHCESALPAQIAVGMGYELFEKHFRLEETPPTCPDWAVSLSPPAFGEYAFALREAVAIVGTAEKKPMPSEQAERANARRGADGVRPAGKTIEEPDYAN